MKLIRKLIDIFDRTIDLMAVLSGVLLIFSLLSVSTAIASRYFLNRPIGWVPEISEYILLSVAFLVAAWVLKGEGHVRMDLILQRLSPKTQLALDTVTSTISSVVCLIFTWYGLKVSWDLFQANYFTPTTLELPKFIFTAIIFLGCLLLSIQFLRRTYVYFASWKASRDKEPGFKKKR